MLAALRCRLPLQVLLVRRCRASVAALLLNALIFGALAGMLLRSPAPAAIGMLTPEEIPLDVAVDPATQRLFLALFDDTPGTDAAAVLDSRTYQPLGEIRTNPFSTAVQAVDSATGHLYVAQNDGLDVMREASSSLLASVHLGQQPRGIGVNPTTNRIYVSTSGSANAPAGGAVVMLDGFDDAVVAEAPLGTGLTDVAVNPRTNRVYVANAANDTVAVLDGATDALLTAIPVGRFPHHLGVDATTNRVYVSNTDDGTVTVLDGAHDRACATIRVGGAPGAIGVNVATHHVVIANGEDALTVLDGKTDAVLATVPLPGAVLSGGIAVDPTTNRFYAADARHRVIRVFQDHRFGLPLRYPFGRPMPAPLRAEDTVRSSADQEPIS